MNPSLPTHQEIARKSYSAVLRVVEKPGVQAALAKDVAVSESTISRWKNEHLEADCSYLAALGFRLVPSTHCIVSRRFLDSCITFAKDRLELIDNSYDLEGMWV